MSYVSYAVSHAIRLCFCTVNLKLGIRIKEHLTNFYPLLSFYIVHMLPPMGRVFHVSFCEHIILRAMYQKAAVSMICISQHIKRVDYLNAPHFSCAEHPPFACLVCWKQPDFRFMHLPVAIGLLTSSLDPKWSQIFRSPDQQEQVAQYFESQVY